MQPVSVILDYHEYLRLTGIEASFNVIKKDFKAAAQEEVKSFIKALEAYFTNRSVDAPSLTVLDIIRKAAQTVGTR